MPFWSTGSDITWWNSIYCLSDLPEVTYTQNHSSYLSILKFAKPSSKKKIIAKPNFIFFAPTYPKPKVIITPTQVSQIRATLKCTQKHGLRIRVRSGGHMIWRVSLIMVKNHLSWSIWKTLGRSKLMLRKKTAWVQAGVTIGELYHRISEKSKYLGFPAGVR